MDSGLCARRTRAGRWRRDAQKADHQGFLEAGAADLESAALRRISACVCGHRVNVVIFPFSVVDGLVGPLAIT